MMDRLYTALSVSIIALYALLGLAGLCAGRPRQGLLALMFCASNALIFLGKK